MSVQPCPRPPCPCLGPDGCPPKKPRCRGAKGKKPPDDVPAAFTVLLEHVEWLIAGTPETGGSRAGFRKHALRQSGGADSDLPSENEISQQLSGRGKYSDFAIFPKVEIITFFGEFCNTEDRDAVIGHLGQLLDELRRDAKRAQRSTMRQAGSPAAAPTDRAVKDLVLEMTGAVEQQRQLLFAMLRATRVDMERLRAQLAARNVSLYAAHEQILQLMDQLAVRQDEIQVQDAAIQALTARLEYAEGKAVHADRKLEELDRLERENNALRTRILQLLQVPIVTEHLPREHMENGVLVTGAADESDLVDSQFEQIVNLIGDIVEDEDENASEQRKQPADPEGPSASSARSRRKFNRDGFFSETLLAMFIVTASAAVLGIGLAALLHMVI